MAEFDDSTITRFWAKVNFLGPAVGHVPGIGNCWIWTAGRDGKGYGSAFGRLAHRVSWEIANGEIPTDPGCVLHLCDTRACVRPDHLWLGTHADNARDRASKGRNNSPTGARHGSRTHPESRTLGERQWMAKLTESAVADIRTESEAGATRAALAARFGVSPTNISMIVLRKTWRHVH